MIKKIAITGGIGSGKSTVLNLLKEAKYPTFSCDEIYKEVIDDVEYIKEIEVCFPSAVENGKINRKILSKIVFSEPQKRKQLDSIAHPLIMKKLQTKMTAASSNLVFAEVPLLFEKNYDLMFDEIIVVLRKKACRIDAVVERDGANAAKVEARMAAQFDYDLIENMELLTKKGVKLLYNNTSVDDLKKGLFDIIKNIT